jgi:hypothetical protein
MADVYRVTSYQRVYTPQYVVRFCDVAQHWGNFMGCILDCTSFTYVAWVWGSIIWRIFERVKLYQFSDMRQLCANFLRYILSRFYCISFTDLARLWRDRLMFCYWENCTHATWPMANIACRIIRILGNIIWCFPGKLYWLIFTYVDCLWDKSWCTLQWGARGSVVGWGTILQAGTSLVRFPIRSLGFSIYLILPTALWPWVRLNL